MLLKTDNIMESKEEEICCTENIKWPCIVATAPVATAPFLRFEEMKKRRSRKKKKEEIVQSNKLICRLQYSDPGHLREKTDMLVSS